MVRVWRILSPTIVLSRLKAGGLKCLAVVLVCPCLSVLSRNSKMISPHCHGGCRFERARCPNVRVFSEAVF